MEYIIRKAKNEDINEIWRIGNKVSEFKTADNIVIFWPKETLYNCIDKKDILFYIVELEKKIIGFSIINLNKSLGKAEIENIYILEQYRKKGVGRKLLDIAIKELKNLNYDNVNALSNDAIQFYKHYGFSEGENFKWMDYVLSEKFKI